MRFKLKKRPARIFDTRIRNKFLLLPFYDECSNTWYWLETVKVKELYTYNADDGKYWAVVRVIK